MRARTLKTPRWGGSLLWAVLGATALCAQTPPTAPSVQATPANQAPAGQAGAANQAGKAAAPNPYSADSAKHVRSSDKRRAAKIYLESSRLFVSSRFEEAVEGFEKAAALDPTNHDYELAAEVARSHAVTALIQSAAKNRLMGNEPAARAALEHARALDPKNFEVSQHLDELSDDAVRAMPKPLYAGSAAGIGSTEPLAAASGKRSFHLHTDARQTIEQVFKSYGVMAMLDDSVRAFLIRVDLDDVSFEEAARVVGMATHTFYVALDAHHALVANDTREIRDRFTPLETETVSLAGLSDSELDEVQKIAQTVFSMQKAQLSKEEGAITIRAPASTLAAFDATMQGLLNGRSQVVLDVSIIQVAHTNARNTGLQLPQTVTAFNVLAEEQSLLSQNAALVQQIISSGLASANNPLAILGLLIASGQVSSPLLSNGFALFGGGLTESALEPGAATLQLSLNSSDSRELDQVQLRLEDGEDGTLKEGEKYPIQTSSFSSLGASLPSIPGLTSAGSSSSLSSLLSSVSSSVPNVPMVQYEDLGLTLKARPKVLRNDDVALNIELKLDALSGQTIDGNPVLDNRAYSGVVTLREGDAVVVATEVDKSQSLAISGTPGLSEIPGLNDLTSKDLQTNYATVVIVMTPHVVRGTQAAGHTAMMPLDKDTGTR